MGSKRFVNLVVWSYTECLYSLRRLDPDQFFHPTAAAAAAHGKDLPIQRRVRPRRYLLGNRRKKKQPPAASPELERIRLPPILLKVRPTACPMKDIDQPNLHGFTLSGNKIFFTDTVARLFCYDTQRRCVVTAPNLHAPKTFPFAISVPSAGAAADADPASADHDLYIMEKALSPGKEFQFEALFWRKCPSGKTWCCESLPPPPFVHEPAIARRACVLCYAVVGDAICISVDRDGTYCFDTVGRTWSRAGDWLMPFVGKAEYVPELKLWFGISAVMDRQLPCALDLSPVVRGHAPGEEFVWKGYLWGNPDVPDEWRTIDFSPEAAIVSLGSGRFCIANFYETLHGYGYGYGYGDDVDREFAVFTGLEVIVENEKGTGGKSSGRAKLRMVKHKSKMWEFLNTAIKSVH